MLRAFQYLTLFLVGFTLPIQGYSLLDFAFGMTPSKAATAILLVLAVLQFGLSGTRPPPDPKRVWVLIFTASYVISCVVALMGGIELWVLLIVGSQQIALILYYLLISYVVQTRRALVLVLWALVLGGAVTAAPAVLGIETGSNLEYGERFQGLAGQENLFGFDMAVCAPIAVALFFAARSLLSKTLLLGLGALCLTGMLLSLSRSAMLSGAIMGAFWVWRSGRIDSLRYLVPAVLVLAGVLFFAPESVMRRIETMTDPNQRAADESIQSRFVQYEWAGRALASNPAIGVGINRFSPWVQQQPGGVGMADDIHNAYLAVAARQGLLGLVPFIAILVLTWRQYSSAIRTVRARRSLRDRELMALGHLATFLQIALLGGLVGGMFGMAERSKTLWLLLGLSPAILAMCRARAAALQSSAPAPATQPAAYALPAYLSASR